MSICGERNKHTRAQVRSRLVSSRLSLVPCHAMPCHATSRGAENINACMYEYIRRANALPAEVADSSSVYNIQIRDMSILSWIQKG